MLHKKHKIIAIPFAGGNEYSFNEVENHISKDFEWITLRLSGRGSRFSEPLIDNISDMVADLYQKIQVYIKEGNYILYGHSMGSLLSYELVKKMIENDLKLPVCLFLTGRGGPSYNRFSEKSTLPQELFWQEVDKMGGLPKDIFDQKELLELYYPILKNDFKAIEDYEYVKIKKPFSIPIHILMGNEEIGDEEEKTTIQGMKSWKNETQSSCTFEILQGNHFFILEQPKTIAHKIMNAF